MFKIKSSIAFKIPCYKAWVLSIVVLFSQKTAAITYYINDNSLTDDLYTKAIGKDTNDGLTPSTPKLSIDIVYKIAGAGDIIYIDTGIYPETVLELLKANRSKAHIIMAPSKGALLAKRSLPATDKTNPTEFYIENDKPVERSVYLNHKRNKGKKS